MALPLWKRRAVLKRDGYRCFYCHRTPPEVYLHVDHKIPKSEGGSDRMDNLVAACSKCNCAKTFTNPQLTGQNPATLRGFNSLSTTFACGNVPIPTPLSDKCLTCDGSGWEVTKAGAKRCECRKVAQLLAEAHRRLAEQEAWQEKLSDAILAEQRMSLRVLERERNPTAGQILAELSSAERSRMKLI